MARSAQILDAAGRHPWRPSHLHFIVKAKGYRDLVTEVFADDDPYLDEDTVFGVREDLVMTYEPQPAAASRKASRCRARWTSAYARVDFDFTLVRGDRAQPTDTRPDWRRKSAGLLVVVQQPSEVRSTSRLTAASRISACSSPTSRLR